MSTVCVPDLAVICNPNKLHEQYCFGAPTVVMEILFPSTVKADRLVKLNRYQQAGRTGILDRIAAGTERNRVCAGERLVSYRCRLR